MILVLKTKNILKDSPVSFTEKNSFKYLGGAGGWEIMAFLKIIQIVLKLPRYYSMYSIFNVAISYRIKPHGGGWRGGRGGGL
jgi:hypothetical protein